MKEKSHHFRNKVLMQMWMGFWCVANTKLYIFNARFFFSKSRCSEISTILIRLAWVAVLLIIEAYIFYLNILWISRIFGFYLLGGLIYFTFLDTIFCRHPIKVKSLILTFKKTNHLTPQPFAWYAELQSKRT